MKRQIWKSGVIGVMAVTLACLVQSAHGYMLGFTNLGGDGTSTWTNNSGSGSGSGSGNGLSNGTDGENWTGAPGTGEVSWNVDWHLTATPTRDIGHVVLYPGSRTPGHFIISKGVWTGSMTWTPVYDNTVANIQQNFDPLFLETNITGASGLKYEVINQGNLGYQYGSTRGMANILLFGTGASEPDRLVSPTSVVQNVGVNINGISSSNNFTQAQLNQTIDGVNNSVDCSIENNGTQRSESVSYGFSQAQLLAGVFITLNPVHGDPWYWRSFEVRDLNGNLLAQSQVGPTDVVTSADRYQFLAFSGGPLTLSGFTVQGYFGNTDTSNTKNARMGEVWGVWVPEPSAALLLGLAALAAASRSRRSMRPK